ncbi:MAG: hypothetical protein M1274_14035 [Actinobacteria bacterium]|nr:hypothetical protein [Actinomycetota bacterium]
MTLTDEHRAIQEHAANGKALHLFECVGTNLVKYLGEVAFAGYQERPAPDFEGNERRVLVLELGPKLR